MKTLFVATLLSLAACSDRPPQVIVMQPPNTEATRPPNVMTVTGAATIEIAPDCADLTMTLSFDGPRSGVAAAELASKQQAAIDALKALGIDAAAITLSQVTLNPVYEDIQQRDLVKQRLVGYRAESTIKVTTKKFEQVAAMMEAGAKAGATRMSSQFRRSDIVELKKKVRVMALQVAREKAELTAKTLGITLGAITSIAETPAGMMWQGAYFPNASNYVANQAPLPNVADIAVLAAATQAITLDVSIGYELGKRA